MYSNSTVISPARPGCRESRPFRVRKVLCLGSSLFGAQLAAQLGLPYAFASHFAPDALHQAVAVYREQFRPSTQQAEPYVMAGVNVFTAEDHDAAVEQKTVAFRTRARAMISRGPSSGTFTDDEIDAFLASPNGRQLSSMSHYTAVGTPSECRTYLDEFAESIQADELILVHQAADIDDRVRSVELTGEAVLTAAPIR